jgi:hypothetical protein
VRVSPSFLRRKIRGGMGKRDWDGERERNNEIVGNKNVGLDGEKEIGKIK